MHECTLIYQAFINTAKEIYRKIQDGVFDVSNEVRTDFICLSIHLSTLKLQSVPIA